MKTENRQANTKYGMILMLGGFRAEVAHLHWPGQLDSNQRMAAQPASMLAFFFCNMSCCFQVSE